MTNVAIADDADVAIADDAVAASPTTAWALRALAGPQQGAQFALRSARYSLGAEDTCDIVLIGEGVAPKHLDLVFADGRLTILRAWAGARINGVALASLPGELEPGDILTIGAVSFAYGDAAGPWAGEDEVANLLAANQDPANDSAAETKEDTEEETEEEEEAEEETEDTTAALDAPPVAAVPPAKPKTRSAPLRALALGVIGAMLAAAAASASLLAIAPEAWQNNDATNTAAPTMAQDALTAATHKVLDTDPTFANVLYDAPRRLARGYVAKEDDLNRLRAALSRLPLSLDIISLDVARRSLDVLLRRYGPLVQAKLEPTKNGTIHLSISGALRSREGLAAFERHIREEMPYVSAFHVNATPIHELEARARETLAQIPGLTGIEAIVDDNGITLKGAALDNFRQDLMNVRDAIAAIAPKAVPITLRARFAPPFPARIVSLLQGPEPHVRLVFPDLPRWNGLYRLDQTLPFGFDLIDIRRDGITLRLRDLEVFLPLKG